MQYIDRIYLLKGRIYFSPIGASVTLWKDRYFPTVALSSAFSAHAGVIREAGVDDSTIRRLSLIHI